MSQKVSHSFNLCGGKFIQSARNNIKIVPIRLETVRRSESKTRECVRIGTIVQIFRVLSPAL